MEKKIHNLSHQEDSFIRFIGTKKSQAFETSEQLLTV